MQIRLSVGNEVDTLDSGGYSTNIFHRSFIVLSSKCGVNITVEELGYGWYFDNTCLKYSITYYTIKQFLDQT